MMAQSGLKHSNGRKGFQEDSPFGDSSIVAACPSPIGTSRGKFFNIPTVYPPEMYPSDSGSVWGTNSLFYNDHEATELQSSNRLVLDAKFIVL